MILIENNLFDILHQMMKKILFYELRFSSKLRSKSKKKYVFSPRSNIFTKQKIHQNLRKILLTKQINRFLDIMLRFQKNHFLVQKYWKIRIFFQNMEIFELVWLFADKRNIISKNRFICLKIISILGNV